MIKQKGKGSIEFNFPQQTIKLDPNRIFTSLGRKFTLIKYNSSLKIDSKFGQQVLARSKQLADLILKAINTESAHSYKILVAMHNNTNGYAGDEMKGKGTISIVGFHEKLKKGSRFLMDVTQKFHDEDDLFTLPKKLILTI